MEERRSCRGHHGVGGFSSSVVRSENLLRCQVPVQIAELALALARLSLVSSAVDGTGRAGVEVQS